MDKRLTSRLHSLSLRQLRCFAAVADQGSFSRASGVLGVSQPALSATIRQMEQRLGAALFDRSTHHVVLSPVGRSLLPHAQRLLVTADHALHDMGEALTGRPATIRIGVMPSAVAMVAAAIVDLADPDIRPHIADGRSDELLAGLRSGQFDAIVSVAPDDADDLATHMLLEDEMLAVVPHGHSLAFKGRQSWKALEPFEIIHFSGGSIGKLAAAGLAAHGRSNASRLRVENAASLYGLVRSGVAIGIMSRLYAQAARTEGVELVTLVDPVIRRSIMLITRTDFDHEYPAGADYVQRLRLGLSGGK